MITNTAVKVSIDNIALGCDPNNTELEVNNALINNMNNERFLTL